eukprot:12646_1
MITRLHTSRRRSLTGSATGEELKMNHKIVLPHSGLTGTIRYLGATLFSEGSWVGVELDRPTGRNDGSVKGTRYFTCTQGYGLFVRATNCQPVSSSTSDYVTTQSTASHGNSSGVTASQIYSSSPVPHYRSTSTTTRLTKKHSNLASRIPMQTPTKSGIKGSQVVKPSAQTAGSSSYHRSGDEIIGRIDDALIEALNTGTKKPPRSDGKGKVTSSLATTMQGDIQDTRRKSSVVMASATESIEAAVMAALESEKVRNAIIKISNTCVAGLEEHVKEMETKLTVPDNGTPALHLSNESGTTTKMEKTATDLGLENRMKFIETKIEDAASIMKGLSDQVDKVMRFITLKEDRENSVPQTCGPELKHALHTVHQLALQATETLVADE